MRVAIALAALLRSRDADASEACHATSTNDCKNGLPKKGGGAPTGAPSIAAPHVQTLPSVSASGATAAPSGAARLSALHCGAHHANQCHGSASGRVSCDLRAAGVTPSALSQSSDAPRGPVIVPADPMPEPPGGGLQIRPREPHSPHRSAVTGRRPFDGRAALLYHKR